MTHKICKAWKPIVAVIFPFALLPFPLIVDTQLAGSAYVLITTIFFFLINPMPMCITAIIPVFLYPLLGVHSAAKVATWFMNDAVILLISSMMFALAIEAVGLHERIALKSLLLLGTKPQRLLLAFIAVSAFLSLWIANIAVCVMLLPMAFAVRSELTPTIPDNAGMELNEVPEEQEAKATRKAEKLSKGLIFAIVYGSCIGGMGTIVGAHPNIVLKQVLDQFYTDVTGFNFATHLLVCGPLVVAAVTVTWFIMAIVYSPKFVSRVWSKVATSPEEQKRQQRLLSVLEDRYTNLGPLKFSESSVLAFFCILLLLWSLRSPYFFPGWETAFKRGFTSDAVPALLVSVILFLWPRDIKKLWREGILDPIMTWPIMKVNLPWELVLFSGGSNILSQGSTEGGLSQFLADLMQGLASLSPFTNMVLLTLMVNILTEFIGNSTIAVIFLPIVAKFAEVSKVNPIFFMLPVALSTMNAFLMPIASPVTALAYGTGRITVKEMLINGFVPKMVCFAFIILFVATVGDAVFDFQTFPLWANSTQFSST